MKLKVGDEVIITLGKDKGRQGKIERILPKDGRALLPNLNVYKRHKKGMPGRQGGIIEFSRPLPISSLVLICPHCSKKTRVGFKIMADKKKLRVCKICKRVLDDKEKPVQK